MAERRSWRHWRHPHLEKAAQQVLVARLQGSLQAVKCLGAHPCALAMNLRSAWDPEPQTKREFGDTSKRPPCNEEAEHDGATRLQPGFCKAHTPDNMRSCEAHSLKSHSTSALDFNYANHPTNNCTDYVYDYPVVAMSR